MAALGRRLVLGFSIVLALLPGVVTAAERVVFEDRFDNGLGEGWSWLREHEGFWRVRDGALEIRAEPGLAPTVQNALLRDAPDRGQGTYAVEVSVTNMTPPTQQYEQAGITWYHEGRPVFKLVKEQIDGATWIIPGRRPMPAEMVQLRLIVSGERWTAQYRPAGEGEFITAEEGSLPSPGKDQISIQCYHGPPDAEHWMRFDDFRVLELKR